MKTSQNVTFDSSDQEYVISLKSRKKPKWLWLLLLLLLLPLLLLIPVKRDVKLQLTESITNLPVSEINTSFSYPERKLFSGKTYKTLTDTTNVEGKVEFLNIKQALWVVLFYKNDSVFVSAENECFKADNLGYTFLDCPKNDYLKVQVPPISMDMVFHVIDKEDNQPLPEANVTIIKLMGEDRVSENGITDVGGNILVKQVPSCGEVVIKAEKMGYQSDSIKGTLSDLYKLPDSTRNIKLKPQLGTIKILVKDLKSNQLLPGATATLTLDGIGTQTLKTNTNGVGVGVFDSVKVMAKGSITVKKTFYYDTSKNVTVSDFMQADEENRTFYLRPSKQNLVFRDVNSANSSPIAGVKNEIYVNGKLRGEAEYSNSQGSFVLSGLYPDDVISIVSSKAGYKTNNSDIQNRKFSDLLNANQSARDIKMVAETPPPPPTPPNPPNPPTPPKADDLKGKSGDLRINLQWYTKTDLDLHVYDPCGNEIWFSQRKATCNGGTGELDLDANAIIGTTNKPQENIYWMKPAPGSYKVVVVCFKYRDTQTELPFNISIVDKNGRKDIQGSIRKGGKVTVTTHIVN